MKTDLRALPWRCLTAATLPLAVASTPSPAAQPAAAPTTEVVCATPDMWTGGARISRVQAPMRSPSKDYAGLDLDYSSMVRDAQASGGDAPSPNGEVSERSSEWRAVYWGPGLGSLRGYARARVARKGVLWGVDPSEIGMTQKEAGAALLREGAAMVMYRKDGKVVFRAPASTRRAIADRVAEGRVGTPSTRSVTVRGAASPVSLDVAMLRVEGGYSSDPVGFIDALPGGMFVYPFGTGFVVYVPRDRVEAMWNAIDGEGRRVLMVGASSAPVAGAQAAAGVGYCGGSALMRRFPTPRVIRSDRTGVVLEMEAQPLGAQVGDVVMVVQAPPYGRGMELALMRVVGR